MDVIETYEHDGVKVEILSPDHIEDANPRTDQDCFTVIVAHHPRYEIGDTEHGYREENGYRWGPGSLKEIHDEIVRTHRDCLIRPLYLMDHGLVGVSLKDYKDAWDSGQVGWVFVTRKMIRENYMVKRVTAEVLAKAEALMASEVEQYSAWLEGRVYRFRVTNPANGETEDSESIVGMEWVKKEANMTARSMYLDGISLDGASNYCKEVVDGKATWHLSPYYTVPDERAEQWEAECEGVRAKVRDMLKNRAHITCDGVDFDEHGHSMFVNLTSTNEHTLKFVLKEMSEIGFATGIF